jgi:ribonuclease HI
MYIQIFSDASYNKLINKETNELLTIAGYSFVVYHSDSLDKKNLSNNQIIHSETKNLSSDVRITDNAVMNSAFLEATALLNALEYARDNYSNDLSFVFYCDSKFICDQIRTKIHQIKTLSKNNNKRIFFRRIY